MNLQQRLGLGFGGIGLAILALAGFGLFSETILMSTTLIAMFFGIILYALGTYEGKLPGIKNDNVWYKSISSKKYAAWILGFILTSFYVIIYWFPHLLGYRKEGNTGLVGLFDPLSYLLNGHPATQWFLYGTLYTLAILGFGIKFILKYRHSTYQIVRTCSLMFFQLAFAFLIPEFLNKLNPELAYFTKDIKNMWPLNSYFFEDWNLNAFLNGGNLGIGMLIWGIAMIFIVSPILTYFYGKRWYCSWVCGCGGLAETAGDSFRQLSDKSETVWKIERWLINAVLLFIFITTVAVINSYLVENPNLLSASTFIIGVIIFLLAFASLIYFKFYKKLALDARKAIYWTSGVTVIILSLNLIIGNTNILFIDSGSLRSWYGFYIGAAFSGVIGVGFYPILGSRVWCRFGCPMAAILGLQQKLFSRFRITTNGSQCISCGNCSTYCEMGIDVRSYAQKGEDILRASCVGCGICSEVCPRGVLKLENGKVSL